MHEMLDASGTTGMRRWSWRPAASCIVQQCSSAGAHLASSHLRAALGHSGSCTARLAASTAGSVERTWMPACAAQVKRFDADVLSVALHPTGLMALAGFADKLRLLVVLSNDLRYYGRPTCNSTCGSTCSGTCAWAQPP